MKREMRVSGKKLRLMKGTDTYRFAERMHDYASLFSCASWTRMLQSGRPADVEMVYGKYDERGRLGENITYMDYLKWVYRYLLRSYRNEYIYKNELVDKYIIRFFGKTDSVAVNEFRVGSTIADLALFNGESKCFEIKSELDTPRRLSMQLSNYRKVFDKCYILVPEESCDAYKTMVDERVGILVFRYCKNGQVVICQEREAIRNEQVDVNVLMCSVRTSEYRWMVRQAYGTLPDVSDFDMFDACRDLLGALSAEQLHHLFCGAVKTRKTRVGDLIETAPIFRQMSLGMNMGRNGMVQMDRMLNQVMV